MSMSCDLIFLYFKTNTSYAKHVLHYHIFRLPKHNSFDLRKLIFVDCFFPFSLSRLWQHQLVNDSFFLEAMLLIILTFHTSGMNQIDQFTNAVLQEQLSKLELSVAGIWIIHCTSFSYSEVCKFKWDKLFSS